MIETNQQQSACRRPGSIPWTVTKHLLASSNVIKNKNLNSKKELRGFFWSKTTLVDL